MNRIRFASSLLASMLVSLAVNVAQADEVSVAVAANFTGPFSQIAAGFEKETGHKVVASFGSTGKFYAQIKNGAPFEVLLAADDETPARLVREGAAVAGTPFSYAIGKLVLWSAKPGVVDDKGAVLKSAGLDGLALTNPKLAPYGAAAVEVLNRLGALDAVQPRLVMAETVTQTYQFVNSGNVPLGFVAMSQVLKDGKIAGSFWVVPADLYTPIRQDAVVLLPGKDKAAATALLVYLKGAAAQDLIRTYGYDVPK